MCSIAVHGESRVNVLLKGSPERGQGCHLLRLKRKERGENSERTNRRIRERMNNEKIVELYRVMHFLFFSLLFVCFERTSPRCRFVARGIEMLDKSDTPETRSLALLLLYTRPRASDLYRQRRISLLPSAATWESNRDERCRYSCSMLYSLLRVLIRVGLSVDDVVSVVYFESEGPPEIQYACFFQPYHQTSNFYTLNYWNFKQTLLDTNFSIHEWASRIFVPTNWYKNKKKNSQIFSSAKKVAKLRISD